MVESAGAGGLGHPGRRDPRAPGDAEPRADAAPPRHPGVRAGADRRQGDPAASARLHGVQRRLRRRPDGRARAAVARSADGSAHADAGVEQRAAAVATASPASCRRRTSCSASTTRRARRSARRAKACMFSDVAEVARAYESRQVELHAKITVRIKEAENAPTASAVEKITRYETTVGRALLSEILPAGLPFSYINKPLKKKEISRIINASFRRCGLRETVIFADKLMQAGYALATRGGISFAADDMLVPAEKRDDHREVRARGEGDRGAVHVGSRHAGRALQQGGRHLGPRRRRHREGDDGAARLDGSHRPRRQEGQAGLVQLHLHDGGLRRARLGGADPAARRHARPDGEAGRLDHRDADHRELPRRPERAAVLHQHARRAQGSRRHGVEDGELGLPDAPPGRRDAGSRGDRGRLRHAATASR